MAIVNINWNPARRDLRVFGIGGLVILAALGAYVYWRASIFGIGLGGSAPSVAGTLWAVAGLLGLMAAATPLWLRPVYIGLTVLSFPIGYVLSHVVMAVVYYGLFTPVGLIFRLIGRDALNRKFDRQAASYWTPRRQVTDMKKYFRQF